MPTTVSLTLLCLGGLSLALAGEYRDRVAWTLIGKLMAASAYLGVAAVAGAGSSDWGRALLVGMIFCWAGDLLLVSKRRRSLFLAGLASFLLGHVCYSIAFVIRGIGFDGQLLPLILIGAFAVVVQKWLRPHLEGAMVGPVHAYLAAISVMWILAVATWSAQGGIVLLLGASLFVLSDLAVARNRFVAPGIVNRLWGLPTYFVAQLLLAFSTAG